MTNHASYVMNRYMGRNLLWVYQHFNLKMLAASVASNHAYSNPHLYLDEEKLLADFGSVDNLSLKEIICDSLGARRIGSRGKNLFVLSVFSCVVFFYRLRVD